MNDLMSSKSIYNERYAGNYREHLSGFEIARWRALDHFITRIMKLSSVNKVLDYGAGSGLHVYLWEKVFPEAELYFCDISLVAMDKFAKKFQRHAERYFLIQDDISSFNDSTFDVIVSVEVMEHVEKLIPYLQDVQRLLKPGGYFIWTTPCANALSIEHIYSLIKHKITATKEGYRLWAVEDPNHLRRLKSNEIKNLLRKNGFSNVIFRFRAHLFSFICAYYFPKRRLNRLRVWLMTLDYSLFRHLPNGASMIGAARKTSDEG